MNPFYCCVCAGPIVFNDQVCFTLEAFENNLYAHKNCAEKIKIIGETTRDYKDLPYGPLYQAYSRLPE